MLNLVVFISGALMMVLEMVGGRVLAPHVGTSAIVWTSLIGVILACLAAGSWAGGRFADRKLSREGLSQILLGASLGCAITAFWHNSIGSGISSQIGNLHLAAVLAAICIFALPAFFFGMVTPYIVRLSLASLKNAGATVGRLYALSTAGSILGTFLGGFVLISYFSSTTILWSVVCVMLLLSLTVFPKRFPLRLALLALFIFLAWQDALYAKWLVSQGAPRLIESPYNSLRVMEGTDSTRGNAPVRLLATDPGYTQSGMMLNKPEELYFDYTRYYALGPHYLPKANSILMLGGGGYSVPKWLLSKDSPLRKNPELQVTVVEMDPLMTRTAREFFALKDDPKLKIWHEDARTFLNRQSDKYDLVFVDVFNSHYSIPFQMGTREAIQKMRQAVAPGGILLMNVISAIEGEDGRLFQSIYQNLQKEFPLTRVYCVGDPEHPERVQNLMLMAFAGEADPTKQGSALETNPSSEEISRMEQRRYIKDIIFSVPPLSDDYAPVERYTLMLTRK